MAMKTPTGDKPLSEYLQDLYVKDAVATFNRINTEPGKEAILGQVNTVGEKDGIYFLMEQVEDSLKRLEVRETGGIESEEKVLRASGKTVLVYRIR